MATPGDPFDTKEREKRRAEQRQLLRKIPTPILDAVVKVMPDLDALAGAAAPAELEADLRDAAETAAAPVLERLIDLHVAYRGSVLAAFLNQHGVWYSSSQVSDGQLTNADYIAANERSASRDRFYDSELEVVLARVAALLIYADRLAKDDYTDERVRKSTP